MASLKELLDLAEQQDVSVITVSRIENGMTKIDAILGIEQQEYLM